MNFWHSESMQLAVSLFWALLGLSLAGGTVLTIVSVLRAPLGREDEAGFHCEHDAAKVEVQHDDAGHIGHTSHPGFA
ncbi:MAG: hypothetical protein WCQ89_01950 [Verrucomicrobiota bacterium]